MTEKKPALQTPCPDSSDLMERFLEMYSANRSRFYAYILSLVPHSSDAEDILQEVTTVMWRKFKKFQSGTDFFAWGMAIARFKVMEFRRSDHRGVQFDDSVIQAIESDAADEMSSKSDLDDALRHCVQKLPDDDRILIRLKYNEELAIKDIALRIGRNALTIYRTLARIHENLLACIRRALALEDSHEAG